METARTQHHRKSYHDLLFTVHRLIIRFNGWKGVPPDAPFIQLLDEHADAKEVVPPALKGGATNNRLLRPSIPHSGGMG